MYSSFLEKFGHWFHIFLKSKEFTMDFFSLNQFLKKKKG